MAGSASSTNCPTMSGRADAVIHAGDFGFFNHGSFERLSDRELRLHLVHSDLSRSDKERILDLSPDERIVAAREILPLSESPAYIEGRRNFSVPVYAVWGNHEDKDVVERLFRGDIRVKNLHILHHRRSYKVGPMHIYGLGGNFHGSLAENQNPRFKKNNPQKRLDSPCSSFSYNKLGHCPWER